MKKITLLFAFMLATITWQTQAQVLSEDFENGVPPTNWTEVRTPSTSTHGWSENANGHSGKCARFNSWTNANGNISVLSTPSFDITGLSNPQLTFYYKNPTGGDFTVQISTDGGTTFTDLATGLTGQADWIKQTYDLSTYSSATVMLAFKGTSNYGSGDAYVYLDDVWVQDASAPYNPEFTLDVTPDCANGQFSVNVNITDLGNATSVSVSDDQGSAAQQATATGTVVMGPYASGTTVDLTVTNDQDNAYTDSHSTSYYCPPANDDCTNAIALTVNTDLNCGSTTPGTNTGATASAQADDAVGTPNHDVWFSFVATETSHVISLSNITAVIGTSTDMAMAVYDASTGCGSLSLIDDSDPNSFTVNGLTVGTTYLLRVYGYSTAQTSFDVCVGTLPPPPVNDECDNAIALTVNPDANCGTTTPGTNASATASAQADDAVGTPNHDVWFSFVATETSHIVSLSNITPIIGTSTDMAMAVYDASAGCGSLSLVDDSDPNSFTITGLTAGTTYLLRVYGYSTAQTTFDVCIGTPPPPPANDDFSGATPITPSAAGSGCSSYTFQAWTAHSSVTDSGMDGSCNGTHTGLDVFYSWTATTNALMWNDGDGSPGIVIRDTSGNEITCQSTLASDDIILSGWTVGQDLIIQIYDYDTADVDVSFCLEEYTIAEPTFTTTINADCANAQFSVDVNVSDFGAATSVTVSDDQGSASQAMAATGTISFGPYASGTSVVFTVTNDQDNTISSTETVVYYCPPANDDCANAQVLTLNDPAVSGSTINSSDLPDICNDNNNTLGDGVWYSFTGNGNEVIVQVDNVAGHLDGELQIYTGTCGNEVCVDNADHHGYDTGESITFTTTAGEVYLVAFGAYGNGYGGHGTFDIAVNETSAIADNQIAGFKFYPNPVNHTLNLSAQGQIENVNIYNITGQEVISIQPNAVQTQVDMSQLQNGIYFVKAQVNRQVTAFKVVKK